MCQPLLARLAFRLPLPGCIPWYLPLPPTIANMLVVAVSVFCSTPHAARFAASSVFSEWRRTSTTQGYAPDVPSLHVQHEASSPKAGQASRLQVCVQTVGNCLSLNVRGLTRGLPQSYRKRQAGVIQILLSTSASLRLGVRTCSHAPFADTTLPQATGAFSGVGQEYTSQRCPAS